jgi:hypothetical protein
MGAGIGGPQKATDPSQGDPQVVRARAAEPRNGRGNRVRPPQERPASASPCAGRFSTGPQPSLAKLPKSVSAGSMGESLPRESRASGLKGDPAHNLPSSAGQAPARLADAPASNPTSSIAPAVGTTTSVSPPSTARLAGRGGETTTQLHAPPAADQQSRVGLIEQTNQPAEDGFLTGLASTRPAGSTPAGITQGEET